MIPDLMTEIERLRDENAMMASKPCLECETVVPGLQSRLEDQKTTIRTLRNLLQRADSALGAVPYHVAGVQSQDPIGHMMALEVWDNYAIILSDLRRDIRKLLTGEQNAGF